MVDISKNILSNCRINSHTICCKEKKEVVAAKEVILLSGFHLTVN